jgi:hypothetical protein
MLNLAGNNLARSIGGARSAEPAVENPTAGEADVPHRNLD